MTLSGSLPPDVPTTFYADLIAMAQEAGVPALLDSSGQPLQRAVAARPYLVKPNRKEFTTLRGEQSQSLPDFAAAVREMAQRYATRVVLSLGADGVLAVAGDGVRHVQKPPVTALSPVGSGDCLLAGLAYGLTHGFSFDEALRHGVAAGTANTLHLGAGNFTLANFERVREATAVERVG